LLVISGASNATGVADVILSRCSALATSKVKGKIAKLFLKGKAKFKKSAAFKVLPALPPPADAAPAVLQAPAVLPPLPPPADAPADTPDMKGMMVRCIDEVVGRSVCGQVLEILSNTESSALGRVQVPGS
jgi:hypothetical protein